MAMFQYKAVNSTKQISQGTVAAKDREEAAVILQKQGLTPLSVKATNDNGFAHGSIPAIEKITFCRYMGIMLSTGLSLSEGIEVMHRETQNQLLKKILSDMQYGLEQGQQLSAIFERYPGVFESYFITLVRAGEMSGKLSEVFIHLETELRAEYSLKTKVKGALLYPIIVFMAMVGIGILMFFFVLPQIAKVFLNLKLPLPAFTRFMFTASLTLTANVVPLIIGAVVIAIGLFFALQVRAVKDMMLSLIGSLPVIRNLIKEIDLARFCRIFSTLIKSAVPITEALEISLSLLTWKQYRDLTASIPNEIRKGKSLADVMREKKVFPSLLVQMVAAGEKTATLDSTMADVATFYEEEVEEEVKGLTQIIEPVMMLMVGISVGVMILSIIAPIYSVVGSLQNAAGTPH